MQFSFTGFALIPLLALESYVQVAAQSPERTVSLPRHAIVFAHHSDASRKNYDIWQIAADGTQMASVVVLPNHQDQFTISPDGDELIYVDLVNGKRDLWRRNFSGKDPVNLTKTPSSEFAPAYSPDGSKLMFSSDRDETQREIYVMSLDTRAVTRMTNNELHDSDGAWSPDGTKFAFTRYFPGDDQQKSGGHGAIFEYDLQSHKERQLTHLGGYCGGVDFSPDGRRIAFHRVADGGSEIWVMESDGSKPKPITQSFIDEYSPAWAPDGNWIVYTAGTGNDGLGKFDLWLMRPDGSGQRLVSSAANTQMSPRWRPGNHFLK